MEVPLSLKVVEGDARRYRRAWRGSVFTSFVSPVLYLLAMGLGLGTLVDQAPGGFQGITYLEYLAPGLLAATAMQTGAGDGSWPVMAGHKWLKTYHATLATPVGIRSLVFGHLQWVTVRVTFVSLVFVGIMALFGAASPLLGLVAVIPAVLTGMAIAAPVSAYAAWLTSEIGLSTLFRFVVVPMFLFSGTFFPVTQLPSWMQPVAHVTPLWHGVALCRSIILQIETPLWWGIHVSYLLAWIVAGIVLSLVFFRRRLRV